MFNNRMLAVAAVLVMAVPALGAATPIVVPPVPEQLVEGHTVFTVIEIVQKTTITEARFAAAVAVLVREVNNVNRARRFPGVLWFNDQYLVNPTSSRNNVADFRYPCGGAVMAVNAGDPDPRILLARIEGQDVDGDGVADTPAIHSGDANHTYREEEYWTKPYTDYTGDGVDDPYYYGQDSGGPGDTPTDYALVGVKPDGSVYSDTVTGTAAGQVGSVPIVGINPVTALTGAGVDYDESYLITDPNDHSWVIDKYNFYTRTSIGAGGPTSSVIYNYPVWVVNILGSPVFTPDQGDSIEEINVDTVEPVITGEELNCLPYLDIIPEEVSAATCDVSIPAPQGPALDGVNNPPRGQIPRNHNVDGATPDAEDEMNVAIPGGVGGPNRFTDNPCKSYAEPSSNGMCYGGQPAVDRDGDTDADALDCQIGREGGESAVAPFRYYNAVLYFRLEDLTDRDADMYHDELSAQTNGCSQEQYWWGPNPPMAADQYPCPGGDDDMEGNSHPFHPTTPTHDEAQPCPPEFGGSNPTNHGGSTYITGKSYDANGYFYPGPFPCDKAHATFNIDIYFSGGGRPAPPVAPDWWLVDLEGSSAPFNGFDGAPAGH